MRESYTATPRLLYVATQLFLKQGFAATSVDQICRTTGVSKGAFFHYYASKDAVAEAAVVYFGELLDEYLFSGLQFFQAKERLARVHERTIEMPQHLHFAEGTLFAVLAREATETQTVLRERLASAYEHWAYKLAELLIANGYQESYSTRLARQWIAVYEGAVAQAKASGDKSIIGEQLMLFGKLVNRN